MGFIDNIKESFGAVFPGEPVYRAVIFGESAGYFENVVGIKSFSTDEISVYLKKGELNIRGSGLYIKKFCEGDLVVMGNIQAMERI